MAKPHFKFSDLRQLLSELGFKEVPDHRERPNAASGVELKLEDAAHYHRDFGGG